MNHLPCDAVRGSAVGAGHVAVVAVAVLAVTDRVESRYRPAAERGVTEVDAGVHAGPDPTQTPDTRPIWSHQPVSRPPSGSPPRSTGRDRLQDPPAPSGNAPSEVQYVINGFGAGAAQQL